MTKRIMYVTPECELLASEGGVGVVARRLPAALAGVGIPASVVMPRHGCIPAGSMPAKAEFEFQIPFLGRNESVRVFRGHLPDSGVEVWFVDNQTHFGGQRVYVTDQIPFESDVRRYSFFAKAVLELIRRLNPDVVHVNDWTGGYVLGWMELANQQAAADHAAEPFPQLRVLTIHNIGYQGQTWKQRIEETDFADLARNREVGPLFDDPRADYDCVNPMRLAMELADVVNTVSPNHAKELTRTADPEAFVQGGQGLEDVVARLQAQGRFVGILNGMDYPDDDPVCDRDRWFAELLQRKSDARGGLARYFADPRALLLGFVGRAVEQKFRLLTEVFEGRSVLEHILDLPGINVFVLASGVPEYEQFLSSLALGRFPDARTYDQLSHVPRRTNFAAAVANDSQLAQRVRLGCDVFLMPSLSEPCGIAQLESLAVGTPPLVRATGGLKDTVVPRTEPAGTGFTFDGSTRREVLVALLDAVREAARVFRTEPERFRAIQQNAFAARFRWADSAVRYRDEIYSKTRQCVTASRAM